MPTNPLLKLWIRDQQTKYFFNDGLIKSMYMNYNIYIDLEIFLVTVDEYKLPRMSTTDKQRKNKLHDTQCKTK